MPLITLFHPTLPVHWEQRCCPISQISGLRLGERRSFPGERPGPWSRLGLAALGVHRQRDGNNTEAPNRESMQHLCCSQLPGPILTQCKKILPDQPPNVALSVTGLIAARLAPGLITGVLLVSANPHANSYSGLISCIFPIPLGGLEVSPIPSLLFMPPAGPPDLLRTTPPNPDSLQLSSTSCGAFVEKQGKPN